MRSKVHDSKVHAVNVEQWVRFGPLNRVINFYILEALLLPWFDFNHNMDK